uniref:Uncharacterized protein n=1 Tax=Globisporangium ultimum (strain ATCC 200006 / CBS 805.95 / DAOM BR144) TaxID=431595 RepID=K3WGG6_GLOUD
MPATYNFNTLGSNVAMPVDVWIPRISKLWSAISDANCPPPSSDNYRQWTLAQLKMEISQRKLKVDYKTRNKEAYAKLLLASDNAVAVSNRSATTPQAAPVQVCKPAPTVVQQPHQVPQAMPVISRSQPEPSPPRNRPLQIPQRPPRAIPAIAKALQPSSSQKQQPSQITQTIPVVSMPTSKVQQVRAKISVISDDDEPCTFSELVEVRDTPSSYLQKRKHVSSPIHSWEIESGIKHHEHMQNQLRIKAAKLDLETRRIEMENKRDAHSQKYQDVQLQLAQEQLKQAKIQTEKTKVEWMIDQVLQRKRLRDAGMSENEISALL